MSDSVSRLPTPGAMPQRSLTRRSWWYLFVPLLLTACTAAFLYLPLKTVAFPDVFEDDFFYYLVVARHILAGQGSTFDGTHLTNGYHPLWMLVFLVLVPLVHGRLLFIVFALLVTGLVLWTYGSAAACLRQYTTPFAAQCIAAFLAINLVIISGGMEITLAVPLLFALCRYRLLHFQWRPWQALIYGLLAAATVLARLDSALFVLVLALLDLALSSDVPLRTRLRAVGPFIAGMSPVLLYLGLNLRWFGTAMPISSHAKQLRFHHTFTMQPLHTILSQFFPEISTLTRPITLVLLCSVLLLAFFGRGRLPTGQRGVVWALLLFMPLHLTILSFTSDWPVWRWYLYPFLVCGLGSAIVLLARTERVFVVRYPYTGFLALLLFLFAAIHITAFNVPDTTNLRSGRYSFYFAATDISDFAATHPGIYAMGDRAGMVGYYLPDPLVQTEGLMMDKPFLENIRLQRNLLDVLRTYKVRYFIATNPLPQRSCFLVREPVQGGNDAPSMRGTFCSQPVHSFESADHFRTLIFDMHQEPPAAEPAHAPGPSTPNKHRNKHQNRVILSEAEGPAVDPQPSRHASPNHTKQAQDQGHPERSRKTCFSPGPRTVERDATPVGTRPLPLGTIEECPRLRCCPRLPRP